MARTFRCQENKILLLGDTFPVKEHIKGLGGRWHKEQNCWIISLPKPETIPLLERLGFIAIANDDNLPLGKSQAKEPESGAVEQHWSVSRFLDFIEAILFQNIKGTYWITGEISSLRLSNGHLFFDLVEKKEDQLILQNLRAVSLSCVLWQGRQAILAEKMNAVPWQDGTQIKICISVNLRKEGARLSGVVEDIDPAFTQGNLLLQRQQTIKNLKQRGLYHLNRQKQLPLMPLCIALITAQGSRAYSDFLHELSLSALAFQVYVFDCHMQGQNTSQDVCNALRKINELRQEVHLDCVVLTRGGGSRLDLRWFDDFEIAKNIAYCPLPVIAAVGHFEDTSVADEVAFVSEKTPTGAARFLTGVALKSLHQVFSLIESLTPRLLLRFERELKHIEILEKKLESVVGNRFKKEEEHLTHIEKMVRIFESSLEYALKRGYALVKDQQGGILLADKLFQKGSTDTQSQKHLVLEMWSQKNSKKVRFSVTLNSVEETPEEFS